MVDMEKRLEMIRAAAKKIEAQKTFKERQALNSAKVRRWTDVVEKPARVRKRDEFDKEIAKLDENHNAWTDAPEYAKTYYGDVYRDTTRFDNDWD